MKIKMELMSDTIFGNGISVPGAEDISVQTDINGFPYYKGSTFKGILREQTERYLGWQGKSESETNEIINTLFGKEGNDETTHQLYFSDFCLSEGVRNHILAFLKDEKKDSITEIMSNVRTFTSINKSGVAKKGSLRMARCIEKGLIFYAEIDGAGEYEELIRNVISSVKWIGTMRQRGFGKVKFSIE